MKAQSTGRKFNKLVPLEIDCRRQSQALMGGFATLEILIAFAVVILCISAVIMVAFGNQSVAVDLETNNEALLKAQALLEKARADSRFDFNLVNPTHVNPAVGGCPINYISDDIYCKKIGVTQTDLFTKKVSATVLWQEVGRTLSTVLTTLLTNPQAADGGDTCSSVLSGDWSNPKILNLSHTIDISPSSLTSVTVSNGYVYITGKYHGNKPDLFIVDVSDPTFPKLQPNPIDTGNGLAAVTVVKDPSTGKKYAYAANLSTVAQLQVIDVSDPSNPSLIAVASRKVLGAGGVGNSIFYYNHAIYLGLTANGAGPQFSIFDVSTPTNPISKGTYTIGHDMNSIIVKDNYAYVVSPDPEELKIFSISNDLMTISLIGGSGVLPDNTAHGESIYFVGNTAYLGRTVGLGSSTKQFYQFDITNHTVDPLPILNSPLDVNDSINGLIIRSGLAFFITNSQFQVWSLSNLGGIYGLLDLSGVGGSPPGALDCESNLFYLGDLGPPGGSGQNVLQIIGPN